MPAFISYFLWNTEFFPTYCVEDLKPLKCSRVDISLSYPGIVKTQPLIGGDIKRDSWDKHGELRLSSINYIEDSLGQFGFSGTDFRSLPETEARIFVSPKNKNRVFVFKKSPYRELWQLSTFLSLRPLMTFSEYADLNQEEEDYLSLTWYFVPEKKALDSYRPFMVCRHDIVKEGENLYVPFCNISIEIGYGGLYATFSFRQKWQDHWRTIADRGIAFLSGALANNSTPVEIWRP